MRRSLVFVFCVFLSAAAWAETVSVTASARAIPSKATIGDEIRLYVEVEHPKKFSARPFSNRLNLSPFEIKNIEPTLRVSGKNRVKETFILTLTTFQLGGLTIPPLPVRYADAFGAEGQVWTEAVKVQIVSVGKKPGDKDDIRPIKGPFSFNLLKLLSRAVGALAAALALILALIVIRRRSRNRVDPESLKPPHERAALELGRLKAKGLLESGMVKEFYSELSDIFRRYLERRFEILALERTSSELGVDLKLHDFSGALLDEARRILENSDLVKFAKFSPPRPLADELEAALRRFVEETKPQEETGKR